MLLSDKFGYRLVLLSNRPGHCLLLCFSSSSCFRPADLFTVFRCFYLVNLVTALSFLFWGFYSTIGSFFLLFFWTLLLLFSSGIVGGTSSTYIYLFYMVVYVGVCCALFLLLVFSLFFSGFHTDDFSLGPLNGNCSGPIDLVFGPIWFSVSIETSE